MSNSFLKKYVGSRQFYRTTLSIAFPIMLQNGITNFVSMLDNVMIGRVGNLEMTGVAIANQLIFVFNLCIFGALSGVGIFGAQYHGKGDHEGVRNTFRIKYYVCLLLAVAGIVVFSVFGSQLVSLYLRGDGTAENAAASLGFGIDYLQVMMWSFVPYAIAQIYASTLRETGETVLPMTAGIVAVIVNLSFNYILIYGHFGAPALGVKGAAIATVISRFVELTIVAFVTHRRKNRYVFISGVYRTMRVPLTLAKKVLVKGLPLLLNEAMWAAGVAMLNQCYSLRGQDVVSATNITNTLWNVVSVTFMALGVTVGIIVGHDLGSGDTERAKSDDRKLIAFSLFMAIIVAGIYAALSPFFPKIYNSPDDVRSLAGLFIVIGAIFMPFDALCHSSYFTVRAGGQTYITFLFDSVSMWVMNVPIAFVLSRYTDVPISVLYGCMQALTAVKAAVGIVLVRRGVWINNIVEEKTAGQRM